MPGRRLKDETDQQPADYQNHSFGSERNLRSFPLAVFGCYPSRIAAWRKVDVTQQAASPVKGVEVGTAETDFMERYFGESAPYLQPVSFVRTLSAEKVCIIKKPLERGFLYKTSRYITTKNRKNTPERLELRKYNPILKKVTLHREIK